MENLAHSVLQGIRQMKSGQTALTKVSQQCQQAGKILTLQRNRSISFHFISFQFTVAQCNSTYVVPEKKLVFDARNFLNIASPLACNIGHYLLSTLSIQYVWHWNTLHHQCQKFRPAHNWRHKHTHIHTNMFNSVLYLLPNPHRHWIFICAHHPGPD